MNVIDINKLILESNNEGYDLIKNPKMCEDIKAFYNYIRLGKDGDDRKTVYFNKYLEGKINENKVIICEQLIKDLKIRMEEQSKILNEQNKIIEHKQIKINELENNSDCYEKLQELEKRISQMEIEIKKLEDEINNLKNKESSSNRIVNNINRYSSSIYEKIKNIKN